MLGFGSLVGHDCGRSTRLMTRSPLGFLILVALLSACSSTTQPPQPTNGAPPPSGQNLIWYKTAGNTFIAALWSGQPVGSIVLGLLGGVQSPDGSRIWQSGIVVDQSAHPVGKMEAGKAPFWADDSRHGCKIADFGGAPPGEGARYLFTMEPSSQLHRVAEVGTNGLWNLEACSVTTDRAVVSRRAVSSVLEVDVIALSTGTVASRYVMEANVPAVAASRDGLYVAEVHTLSALGSVGSTTIRQTTDGKVLATLDAEVRAFSWDSLRAVVVTRRVDGRGETRVIDWLDGRVVWHRPFPSDWPDGSGQSPLVSVLARPGNSELALQFRTGVLSDSKEELWVIDNEGRTRLVASGLISPAF
jgi:hypothetical protein